MRRFVVWGALMMALVAPVAHAQEGTVYVDAGRVNLRAQASTEAAKVRTLARGDALEVLERQQAWVRVRAAGGAEGWVFAELISETAPTQRAEKAQKALSDGQIKKRLIEEDLARYDGSCPCPYHVDRAGRRCGRRSAYSRPGGRTPLCYPRDVTREMVERYRARQAAP